MNTEILQQPDLAEAELQRILEIYQESPLATLETYAYFGVDGTAEAAELRTQTKEQFLNVDIRNPKLNYPVLEDAGAGEHLGSMEKISLDLMKDSVRLDYDSDREVALYNNLRIRYLEVAMLQISRRLAIDGTLTRGQRAELAELFNIANDEVYGYLKPNKFNGYSIEEKRKAFTRLFAAKFDLTKELHNRLLDKALERAY